MEDGVGSEESCEVGARSTLFSTGGVSYTVGGASAPPTLRFAPPTFGRFGGFLALNGRFTPWPYKTVTFVDILAFSFLFLLVP